MKSKDSDEQTWYMFQDMRREKTPEKWIDRVLQSRFSSIPSPAVFGISVKKAVLEKQCWEAAVFKKQNKKNSACDTGGWEVCLFFTGSSDPV